MATPKLFKKDMSTFVLASLLLGAAFSISFEGPLDLSHWLAAFIGNSLLVAISLAIRLYIQKIRAQRYKANVEFELFAPGGAAALLTALLTAGKLVYTQITTLSITPKRLKSGQKAIIAYYGLLASFALVIFSKLISNHLTFANELMLINTYMVIFNIIPASTIINKLRKKKFLLTEGDKIYINQPGLWKVLLVAGFANLYVLWSIPKVLTALFIVFLISFAAYEIYIRKVR